MVAVIVASLLGAIVTVGLSNVTFQLEGGAVVSFTPVRGAEPVFLIVICCSVEEPAGPCVLRRPSGVVTCRL